MKISLAVAALLSAVSVSEVYAIHQKSNANLSEKTQAGSESSVYTEMGRFINSKGEAINLAQETGHARLVLTKVRKFQEP